MNEAWNKTQTRLRKWQRESSTGWELRRILSDSEYFKVIAICAHKRSKNPPAEVNWQDWWAFHLERLGEREAIQLLLDAWNKDVLAHMNHDARADTQHMLNDIAEQSRLAHAFSLALDIIVAEATSERRASPRLAAKPQKLKPDFKLEQPPGSKPMLP
jgi:hypothetical protein